jgi:predicted RNA-binding Zn-ribbon protein involved in translation (DUF1610 family)
MIKNVEGYCPQCGSNSIVLAVENKKIVDKYCPDCGYRGIGIEIIQYFVDD